MTAFVVLPTASSGSVIARTLSGRSAISAMPPALSVTGPYASSATIRPVIESCAMTATPMPKRPAKWLATRMPVASTTTGSAVACMPTARPSMMFVACPVCDAFAIDLTGFQRVPV